MERRAATGGRRATRTGWNMEDDDCVVILTRILGQKERTSDELGTSVYENGPTEAGARPNPA